MNISTKSLPYILTVDDNKENLLLLRVILNKIEVNVVQALSGPEALAKSKGIELALAIIDVRMPGMNGYELAVKINEERSKEKVPVIFITANYFSEIEVNKGYSSGAVDYMFKPFNHQILLHKINIFLDLFRQKQVIIRDAALLKQAGEELTKINSTLRQSKEKYKTLLNASPDGIFIINLKGIITEVSEIGLELLGVDNKSELIGKHFKRFVPREEKNTIRWAIEKTMNEGIAQNIEIRIKKKNQSLFLSEISLTLIQGLFRVPFAFMITLRDISQRKKMEKKLIHADRMASLGEMASGIAHEINQPLNTVSFVMDNILCEAAKDGNIDKDYLVKKSNKIFENIIRIRNIIDHIRDFARSPDDYIPTGFDINSSINNAVAMITEQFKHLSISLSLELEDNLPLIIGNTFNFEQVILNLLSNSKDALLEKKKKQPADYDMFIKVKSFRENQYLVIEFIDNGMGISDVDVDNIMLPFYTTKDTGQGTGLGLSISYNIIKEMNGSIEITNNIFDGATFRIILQIQNKT